MVTVPTSISAPACHPFWRVAGTDPPPSARSKSLSESAGSELTPEQQEDERSLVLLVEDNDADVLLVEHAIERGNVPVRLHVIDDGEKAIQYLEAVRSDPSKPCPAVLLLDLNLPKRPGTDVLEWLRLGTKCQNIPVIILTSSDSAEDRRNTARLGANRYFRKPTSYVEFLKIGDILNEVLAERNQ